MALKTGSTFNDIPVCAKCGWIMVGPYEVERHSNCPHIAAGALAVDLAGRFPALPSTKCGYGGEKLTFELDERAYLSLECRDDCFHLECVWLLDDLTPDEAAGLVQAISAWRAACLVQRTASTDPLSNDEIIEVRDALIAKGDASALSVTDQNLLRDCDIALGVVRCAPRTREEARARVARALASAGRAQGAQT